MQIRSGPLSWQPPRTLLPPVTVKGDNVDPSGQENPDPNDPELAEQIVRWVGKGSQAIAMAPQFLEAHPAILEKLSLKGATPYVEGAAGLFGGLGTLSLAAAGTMQVRDGIRHHNSAEILSGASEIARGGYVGTFATSLVMDRQPFSIGSGLGLASGALQTAAGLARLRHHKRADNPIDPKVVGLIEAGMGISWMGSLLGAPVGLCFAVRMGLIAGKTAYTHQQDWKEWTHPKGRG